MLENYLKKIESLISPNNYSRSNFKDKISIEPLDDDLIYTIKTEGNGIKTEEEHICDTVNQEENEKIMKKRIETEGKLEAPEDIKINSSKSVQSALLNTKKNFKIQNSEGDAKSLLDKIHNLNLKNMTYRNDIEKFKHKIKQLTQEIDNQKQLIIKYENEKESSVQYLLKLENMLNHNKNNINCIHTSQEIKTQNMEIPISTSKDNNDEQLEQNSVKGNKSLFTESNFSVDVTKNNYITIDDKKHKEQFTLSSSSEVKEFITKLYKENQKLKMFQKHVFEISKSYDDINDNLHESIMKIQELVNNHEKGSNFENALLGNYQKVVNNVNATLHTKQKEYNILIKEKDEQIVLIQNELLFLSNDIEERKKDRTKEIQIIINLEEEVKLLKQKLNEFGYYINNNKKEGFILKMKFNSNLKIEKSIEPAKTTLNTIVKHIETNLDMKDQSNEKCLEQFLK